MPIHLKNVMLVYHRVLYTVYLSIYTVISQSIQAKYRHRISYSEGLQLQLPVFYCKSNRMCLQM